MTLSNLHNPTLHKFPSETYNFFSCLLENIKFYAFWEVKILCFCKKKKKKKKKSVENKNKAVPAPPRIFRLINHFF